MPEGALAGVRVCDLTWVLAGPQATRILAEYGAEVIKIEGVAHPDESRFYPPHAPGSAEGALDASAYFAFFNRSKRDVNLDVKNPKGMELLRRIIAVSDVVIENYSSRVMESWGLDYAELERIRPGIIYCSMAGFGHTGPRRDYLSYGPIVQAVSGLSYLSGLPGREPAAWGYSYMDHTGGYYGAMAVLTALYHRNRTGRGQYIDLAQADAAVTLTGTAILDSEVNGRPNRRPDLPIGNRLGIRPAAPHGIYPAAGEDRWLAIAVMEEEQWSALRRVMGEPEWSARPEFATAAGRVVRQDELDGLVGAWTRAHEARALMEQLQAAGVPAGLVQNGEDLMEHDPQLAHTSYFQPLDHPVLGTLRNDRPVASLSDTPPRIRGRAPLFGEHTREVLGEVLGLSEGELDAYEASGAFRPVDPAGGAPK